MAPFDGSVQTVFLAFSLIYCYGKHKDDINGVHSMNKHRSVIAPEQLGRGDIIQYPTQGTLLERQRKPFSYGYVHYIEYDAQHGDEVVSVRVLPIEKYEDAKRSDLAHRKFNSQGLGSESGLAPNHAWAAILAPLRLDPKMDHCGKDGMVQRIGNISHTDEEKRLIEHIDNFGGDERMYYERFGGPREARLSVNTWGLYAPVGIKRDRFEETEYVEAPKRQYKKKARYEGQVLDIDLDKAVEILGLDKAVADLFERPADGRLKKIDSLREANALFSGDGENAAKYIPKETRLAQPVALADLEKDNEIHIAIINGLAEPRKGASVKPILDLQGAFELVTQRPEEMPQYMFMGPKMREYAAAQIPAAYNERAAATTPEERIAEVGAAIKNAWRGLTNAYSEFMISKTVPEAFVGKDGNPAWKMVPKAP